MRRTVVETVIDDEYEKISRLLGSPFGSLHYVFEIPGRRFQEIRWATNFREHILAQHYGPAGYLPPLTVASGDNTD